MTLTTFLLLIVSHVLGDVIFTSYRLAVLKRNSGLSTQILAVGFHSFVHALFAGMLLLLIDKFWLKAALLVLVAHFSIDFLRCRVEMKLFGTDRIYVKRSELMAWISGNARDSEKMKISKLLPWLMIHILDQSFHMASLYGIALLV